MRAPSATFRAQDFPTLSDALGPDDTDRFLRLLNSFCKQTESAFKGGITFGENAHAFLKTVTFTANGWTDLVFQHSWGATAPGTGYLRRAGSMELQGSIGGGVSGTTVCQLPAGFRPGRTIYRPVVENGGSGPAYCSVDPDGNLSVNGAAVSTLCLLDGVSFPCPGPSSLCPSISIANTLKAKPAGVIVLDAQDVTESPAVPVSLGGVAFQGFNDQVLISDLSGLCPARKYRVSLLVIGG